MQKWIVKAVVQKVISFLPFSNNINYAFQKYVTKGVELNEHYFFDKLEHARDHLNAFSKYSSDKIPHNCLELGTGWYPIIPISYYLVGADRIFTIDISHLTSKKKIKQTIDFFLEEYNKGTLQKYISIDSSRLQSIIDLNQNIENYSFAQVLEKLRIRYLVQDASKLHLLDNTIDLITSNNTLEHIYPQKLYKILREFRRIIHKDGIMCHFIDMSDHFAHFDKSISIYNYLKFTDKQWQLIDNSVQPQNRLRIDEYRQIYIDLVIPITEENCREGDVEELKNLVLADKYLLKDLQTMAISHCQIISKISK